MPRLSRVSAVVESWYSGSGGSAPIAAYYLVMRTALDAYLLPFRKAKISFLGLSWEEPVKPARCWTLITLKDHIWGWKIRQKRPSLVLAYSARHTLWGGLQLRGSKTIVAGVGVSNRENPRRRESGAVLCHVTFGRRRRGRPNNRWVQSRPPTGRNAQDFNCRRPRQLANFNRKANVWNIAAGNHIVMAGNTSSHTSVAAHVTLQSRILKP
jgi:hypothetical protein